MPVNAEAPLLPAHTGCLQAAPPGQPTSTGLTRPPVSERPHIRVGTKDTEKPEPALRCSPRMIPATSDVPASLQGGGALGNPWGGGGSVHSAGSPGLGAGQPAAPAV